MNIVATESGVLIAYPANCSTGELTRGMCVVDRREDESAYAPGENRSLVQSALAAKGFRPAGEWESTAIPAQVEVENEAQATQAIQPSQNPAHMSTASSGISDEGGKGSICVVTRTPGTRVMLQLLLQRIWGVEL